MPTGQTIVNNALTILGINEQGGAPSASDSVDALNELNSMWDAWGIDEGLIYAVLSAQYPITANVGHYTIGVGATFSAPRPQRIYKAFFVQSVTFTGGTTSGSAVITLSSTAGLAVGQDVTGTGVPAGATIIAIVLNTSITISINATATGTVSVTASGGNRNELKIINAQEYYSKNDLGALASTPSEFYPDYNADASGFAKLYLYPIPTGLYPARLELDTAVNFSVWTLGANYIIPAGFQDLIQYSLAARLIPRFGMIVPADVAQVVIGVATKAEQRIREMNALNRQQPPEAMAVPNTAPQKVA